MIAPPLYWKANSTNMPIMDRRHDALFSDERHGLATFLLVPLTPLRLAPTSNRERQAGADTKHNGVLEMSHGPGGENHNPSSPVL